MEVECVFFGPLRDAVGEKTVVERTTASSVGELLDGLATEYPSLDEHLFDGQGAIADNLVVTVNRKHIQHLDDLATPIREGDTLRLTPAFYGG